MKKTLLPILFLVTTLSLSGQTREKYAYVNPIYDELLPSEDNKITFSKVYQVDGLDSDDLYIKMNEWIVNTFNSPKDVIQFQDKEAGKIICKTMSTFTAGKNLGRVDMDIYFLLTIESRDGRYKITATNFTHEYSQGLGVARITNSNPLEEYYRLKSPTKRELKLNMEIAEQVNHHVTNLIKNSYQIISKSDSSDW